MPAGIIVTIIVVVVFLLLVGVVSTYNALVRLRNQVDEAFATMDVYLKKRWDLVPNLVEVVKAYAKHEVETFSEILCLRNKGREKIRGLQKIYFVINEKESYILDVCCADADIYDIRDNGMSDSTESHSRINRTLSCAAS